jgi:two-component system NarL family response regulator
MTLRVALVDDHQPFRDRLRALLQRDPAIEIVVEASSGQELLDLAQSIAIDVVCMDIRLPGMNGIEATRRLLALRPSARVIGLSAYAEPHYVEAMLEAGAVGQFTKGEAGAALLRAIHDATEAEPLFGANVAMPAAEESAAPARTQADAPPLGPREVQVLGMIGKGLDAAEIARILSIDPSMIDVYRRNMVRKLNLADDRALSVYARVWSETHDTP